MDWFEKLLQSEWYFLIPLATFLLGGLVTFVITSVNHRRIHRDDVRKTVFDAVLNAKNCASEYWLSPYNEKKHGDLVGSIVFLQRIVPLSNDMMNRQQRIEIETTLAELIIALMGTEQMAKKYHKISLERVARVHTISGGFLKDYYSIYLKQTTMLTLTIYPRWIQIGNLL